MKFRLSSSGFFFFFFSRNSSSTSITSLIISSCICIFSLDQTQRIQGIIFHELVFYHKMLQFFFFKNIATTYYDPVRIAWNIPRGFVASCRINLSWKLYAECLPGDNLINLLLLQLLLLSRINAVNVSIPQTTFPFFFCFFFLIVGNNSNV